MINQEKVEVIYDKLDSSSLLLCDTLKCSYLDAFNMTCENILNNNIKQDVEEEISEKLLKIIKSFSEEEFNTEEIRKGMQLTLLRAFKEDNLLNGEMTPDTIGMLMGYLISKLYDKKSKLKMLDPLIGTANLITSIVNHIDNEVEIIGIDNHEKMIKTAKTVCNMQNYDAQLYFQDSLLTTFKDIDVVVADLPSYSAIEEEGLTYFPFLATKKHLNSLKEDGFMFLLVPHDYFAGEEAKLMRKYITDVSHIIGMIELPDTMFVGKPKSILILRKNGLYNHVKEVLMAKLPSFINPDEVNSTLIKIDMWFEKTLGGSSNENTSN